MHGGTIDLASPGEGGTEVTLDFPIGGSSDV